MTLLMGASAVAAPVPAEDMAYLESLARAVLDESRVAVDARVGAHGPNVTGGPLIRPGGREDYPAFWIRDCAMSLDSGLITPEEQWHMLLLTAKHQPDEEITLPSGSIVPPGSIPDHIGFGDVPIYFPGNLEDYPTQGGPQWGRLPCLDDAFFFIHMAWAYSKVTKDRWFLNESVNGKALWQRLEAAYAMPPSREDTGIVSVTEETRGINFGFFDTTVNTGDLLFCSLLKLCATRELVSLFAVHGDTERAAQYQEKAAHLAPAIELTFATESGWLRASTGLSGQYDVWGTAFAVWLGALSADAERRACEALADGLRRGTIAWEGGIRHVPTDGDFSPDSAWERSYAQKNRYQNGAYWHTPAGWVCFAAMKADPESARALAAAYVEHMREGDFRKGKDFGAPWECEHPEGGHRQNPIYLTSITQPLAVFREMAAAGPANPVQ